MIQEKSSTTNNKTDLECMEASDYGSRLGDNEDYRYCPVDLELSDKIRECCGVKEFLAQMNGLPRLNFEGQQEAKKRIDEGDLGALEELLITGIPWVCSIAEGYAESNPDAFLDYFQEGMLGLRRAIKNWKPRKSALATYGYFWISQRIRRFISDCGSTIRLPAHMYEKREKMLTKIRKGGKIPPDIEVDTILTVLPPASLNSDLSWLHYAGVEEHILRKKEDLLPPGFHLFEYIIDPIDMEEQALNKLYKEWVRTWFYKMKLTERQQYVVVRRFGFDRNGEKRTLEEVSQELEVTRERVRQIQQKAIRRLRHPKRAGMLKIKG